MKVRQNKSLMWKFFDPIFKDKASCNLCKLNFSYKTSTTNLRRHLERRHPFLLSGKTERTKDENGEFLEGENILIEYCEDAIDSEEKDDVKETDSIRKILRVPISKTLSEENSGIKKNRINSKFSKSKDPRNELLKVELEIAKKELELKEWQLVCGKREDERRQKEHEINLKIKEAELQTILNKINN